MVRPGSAGRGSSSNDEGEVTDDGVMEAFVAVVVESNVVAGPSDTELVAAGGELADEFGQVAIIRVATGFDAQDSDGGVGDVVPVGEELGGAARRGT